MKRVLIVSVVAFFLSACGEHLSADQISKMDEGQIKQITPDQIGKMTPGEIEVFHQRRSALASARTKAELENARSARSRFE